MSNQKWEIGPVKLANGWNATIYQFCEKRRRYIGEVTTPSGAVFAAEWTANGLHSIADVISSPLLNLAPPPKKTMRFRRYFCLYPDYWTSHLTKEEARADMAKDVLAMIEIDREVEQGEGLE